MEWGNTEGCINAPTQVPSPQCSDMTVRNASVQSDWADPRTTARRHLAYAMAVLGHEHVATRIDGYTSGIVEVSI